MTWSDISYGLRRLRRAPGFAAAAVAAFGLGIGAPAAIFSVISAVVIRPLPYEHPDRLVMLWETSLPIGMDSSRHRAFEHRRPVTSDHLIALKKEGGIFSDVAGYTPREVTINAQDRPERVRAAAVSADFFRLLGLRTELGRTFLPEEDRPGSRGLVIVSKAFWDRTFKEGQRSLPQEVRIDGYPCTVIGVLSPNPPLLLPLLPRDISIWVPSFYGISGNATVYLAAGRLAERVTINQAQSMLNAAARRFSKDVPAGEPELAFELVPLHVQLSGWFRPILLVLFGAVCTILLISCVNIAHLLLADMALRSPEMGLRLALGARPLGLIRQVLVETLALSLIGGAAGILLSGWGSRFLMLAVPADTMPRLEEASVDWRVVLFGAAVAIGTGFVCGLAPALQAVYHFKGRQLVNCSGTRTGTEKAGRGVRRALIVTEAALAFVLLNEASLLIDSFANLATQNPGFTPQGVLVSRLVFPEAKYQDPERRARATAAILRQVEELPGVSSAAVTNSLPIEPAYNANMPFIPEGDAGARSPTVALRTVSAQYFQTIGISLQCGRPFTERDLSLQTAIVNRALVARFWPERQNSVSGVLGKRIKWGDQWREVIGVVGDVRHQSLNRPPEPEVYVPYSENPLGSLSLVVRTRGEPMALAAAVRRAVRLVDREVPLHRMKTMDRVLADSIAMPRFYAVVVSIFSGVALLLAAIGTYAMISHSTKARAHELAVRSALGASRGHILRDVVGEGALLAAVGVAVGLPCVLAATRAVSSLLFITARLDFVGIGLTSAFLLAVSSLAALVAARRTANVDPMNALRSE